jgi:hypothetical protein
LIPQSQQCCGAIHYHSGASEPAVELIHRNVTAFAGEQLDAIIVNVAGCGSMLKDYSHILTELRPGTDHSAANDFVDRMQDVSEFLIELGIVPPTGSIDATVAYQDACHLQHAQRIREQPRTLLEQIPSLRLVPVAEPELCCGAAGSYNLTQTTNQSLAGHGAGRDRQWECRMFAAIAGSTQAGGSQHSSAASCRTTRPELPSPLFELTAAKASSDDIKAQHSRRSSDRRQHGRPHIG